VSLSTARTALVATLLVTLSTAAYAAAKTKAQTYLGWAFVGTWFGLFGLVAGVIWFMVRLDRRTAGIERGLVELNRTLLTFRRGSADEP
jgi:hypothetical protein